MVSQTTGKTGWMKLWPNGAQNWHSRIEEDATSFAFQGADMNSDPAVPTLLYVEDDVLVQHMLQAELEEAGFNVLVANSGADALAVLAEQSHELHGLITDINLGDGPDGWEVARTARELMSGLPIVYVSAVSEHEWTSQGVPASVMISKPFVPAQVVVAISSLRTQSE